MLATCGVSVVSCSVIFLRLFSIKSTAIVAHISDMLLQSNCKYLLLSRSLVIWPTPTLYS